MSFAYLVRAYYIARAISALINWNRTPPTKSPNFPHDDTYTGETNSKGEPHGQGTSLVFERNVIQLWPPRQVWWPGTFSPAAKTAGVHPMLLVGLHHVPHGLLDELPQRGLMQIRQALNIQATLASFVWTELLQ